MSYIGNTPGVSSQRVVTEEVISGSPKSAFYPVGGYSLGYVDVLVNGLEVDTSDFTATDGVLVTLGTAAAVGDTVKIKCYLPRGLSDGYLKSEADARYPRVDTASQGLDSTQKSNARTNIGAQAALGYTPVNKAGDTVTGLIDSTFTFKDLTPAVRLQTTDSGDTFKHASHALAANMTTSQTASHWIGQAASLKNMAQYGFRYSGTSSSDNNVGTLGLWGKNHIITFDGRGCVNKQYNPAFKAFISANYTLNGSNRSPTYGQEVFDNGGNYDPSTSLFTAPVDGVYLFNIGIGSQGASTAVFIVTEIQVNGVTRNDNTAASFSASASNNVTNTELGSHVSFLLKLAANDTVKPWLYAPADVTLSGGAGWPSTRNYFSGFLVG